MPLESPITIALIDDEEIICESLSKALIRKGYIVHAYTRPETFLQEAPWTKASMIITDVSMPGLDGHAVCAKLEADGYQGLFVFITAAALGDEQRETLCQPYIVIQKPFRTREFVARVQEFLEKWNVSGTPKA